MPKLTVLHIRNAKGPCRLVNGGGLYYDVTSTGLKRWMYRYRIDGKGNMFILGHYPEMTLEQARQAHRAAKALVRKGINPSRDRRRKKQQAIEKEKKKRFDKTRTFEYVALDWIAQQRDGWSKAHSDAVLTTLQKNVFNSIGDQPIDIITPPQILKILRKIEARGSLEITRKVLQRMSAVFRYAIQTGIATYNPASEMKGALKAKVVEHMPAVFGSELGKLMRDIAENQKIHLTTKLALQFTALTACRPGEVRGARWSEVHLKEREWHIPGERMKMKRPHIVPLSKQAMAVINRAAILFGDTGLIFPSVRDYNKPMSDAAMSKALRDMGYRGKATPHGFRSSFSSLAHEKSGFPSEVIEKSLAHEEGNRVKAAYNRTDYLEQRRALMNWWGDQLQKME